MTPDPKVFRHLLALAGPAAPELVRRFRADFRKVQVDLDHGFDTGNADLLRHALHTLIALAGTAGCAATQDAATRLHAAIRTGDDAAAQALRPAVMQGLAVLIAMVDGHTA